MKPAIGNWQLAGGLAALGLQFAIRNSQFEGIALRRVDASVVSRIANR
jgi:hypothetical protein